MCIKKDILSALAYFDLFRYPLKKREIFIFLNGTDELHQFDQVLDQLVGESIIFQLDEFYSLHNNYSLAIRRRKGNDRAVRLLRQAESSAAIISAFPFVRGVAVSGSLSKKFADQSADIDFFIITAANRLWLARTFLHLFKKFTFLFNLQHRFCMNYFVDEAGLEIVEKNIYTATEVATLLPIRGSDIFRCFYKCNSWSREFLPNNYLHVSALGEMKKIWYKSLLERIFNNHIGNLMDSWLLKLTASSWNAKARRKVKNSKGFIMNLHTGKHFAKPDPANFQKNILERYEKKIAEILDRHELFATARKETL